jgi:hypothetical protein
MVIVDEDERNHSVAVFCGIDWAEDHHDIALVDQDGTLLAKRRIGDDAAGFAVLLQLLAEAGADPNEPIPVAIETSHGLLVAGLRATGRPVYPINPMSVSRYRDRHSVARRKSDAGDAFVLANILRTDLAAHRPLPADSELAQAIAVLARAQQDAVWARTDAHNKLRSLLREFYPAILQAFASKRGGLLRPEARALLPAAPTPRAAARRPCPNIARCCAAPGLTRASGKTTAVLHRRVKNQRLASVRLRLGVRRADRLARRARPLRPPQSRRGPPRRRPTQPIQPAPGLPALLPAHPPDLQRSRRLPHHLKRRGYPRRLTRSERGMSSHQGCRRHRTATAPPPLTQSPRRGRSPAEGVNSRGGPCAGSTRPRRAWWRPATMCGSARMSALCSCRSRGASSKSWGRDN